MLQPTNILAIDPGTTESGICLIQDYQYEQPYILRAEKLENNEVVKWVRELCLPMWVRDSTPRTEVVIEGMANQSRMFGDSSIQTCYYIGKLLYICETEELPVTVYKRHEYGRFFVTSGVLNDSSLRAALETIWGPSAKKTDPLYALRGASDKRSAFALAKYHQHMLSLPKAAKA